MQKHSVLDQCLSCNMPCNEGSWRSGNPPQLQRKKGISVDSAGRNDDKKNEVNNVASSCVKRGQGRSANNHLKPVFRDLASLGK